MPSSRTKEEQAAAEAFHKAKCCTTRYMCFGAVILFVGLVLLVSAIGIYNAWELDRWSGAQYQSDCYIQARSSTCSSVTCTDDECSQNTYFVTPDDDSTCAVGECPIWDNGCTAITFVTECEVQHEYETGDLIDCYAYSDEYSGDEQCNNAGRLDPDGEWQSQRTTYVVLLVFAIILIIVAVVLFILGGIRCVCKKMEDDILGSTNGTGCYWCMDWERCCYGEGTGDATVVNPMGRNLPVKDKQRKTRSSDGGRATTKKSDYKKPKSRDYDDDEEEDEEAGLR